MPSYIADAAKLTEVNIDFRQVLCTGSDLKLALMALIPGQCIAIETHAARDLANSGDKPLRLHTLYGSKDHLDQLTRGTQAETPAGAVSCASRGKASMS